MFVETYFYEELRDLPESEVVSLFDSAYREDPTLSVRALFFDRDIVLGKGNRRSFRSAFRHLISLNQEASRRLLRAIPEFGRWDDVLHVSYGTPVWGDAVLLVKDALSRGDSLCAKWLPREHKRYDSVARALMRSLGLAPKEYRKLLSSSSNTVETLMCSSNWSTIDFSKVPRTALRKYHEAFKRHDGERYASYIIDSLWHLPSSPTPKDILVLYGAYLPSAMREDRVLENLWKNLPDFSVSFLPVVDVSSQRVFCSSLGLGIYLAERGVGFFRNRLVSFSQNPNWIFLPESASLVEKVRLVAREPGGPTVNILAVFDLVLAAAKASKRGLPGAILVLTDKPLDQASPKFTATAVERLYLASGYKPPLLIWWQLAPSRGVPKPKIHSSGAIEISGFSRMALENVLSGNFDPYFWMVSTLNHPRYSKIVLE